MEPVGRSKVLNALRDLDFGFFSRFRIGNSSTPHSCSMWHQSKRQLSGMSASCQAVLMDSGFGVYCSGFALCDRFQGLPTGFAVVVVHLQYMTV